MHRRNGKIRAREVRVVGDAKQQLGVMSLNEALRLAQAKGLDLVEDLPQRYAARVPYRELRQVPLRGGQAEQGLPCPPAGEHNEGAPNLSAVDPHDMATKRDHAIRFLCDDMKVRVKLRFRGRQKAHKEIGFQVINQFVKDVAAYGQADSPPKMLGDRDLNVVLSPLPRNKRAKSPREEPSPSTPPSAPPAAPAAPATPATPETLPQEATAL